MPRPAKELLRPDCPEKPAWAVFDRGWYLHHYPEARALCADKEPEFALLYYLRVGGRNGHSPSPLFDETYYLDSNPDVAELVRGGHYISGFDHYCQHGWRGVSPHWLFDDALYAALYDDMTLENLEMHGCFGRYDHYLRAGQRERRLGHFLFDGHYYREQALAAGIGADEIDGPGPYGHFLACLGSGRDELPPSIYFDPAWYIAQHPTAREEVAGGRYVAAIHHYLTNKTPELFDPLAQFSEGFYRRRYPDIAAAIEAGLYRNAYQQFVQHGCFELRQPSADIDLAYYRDMHRRVRDDVNAGRARDAFAHLRLTGLAEGLDHTPPLRVPVLEEQPAREAFLRAARAELALFARQKLDFACKRPALAVIMVAYNKFELTMRSLASLRRNYAGGIQLVLVDNGSTDATRRIGDYVEGAIILRNERNLGFLRACNQALEKVSAPALLYLNNDVELGHGAVAAALRRLRACRDAGAVCGKIIRTHGRLQEAGSIIWSDGTASGYLRDGPPLAPEANFLREVDFGSAVFLLCRGALVKRLGGFDEAFTPAYCEDADLCVRMIKAGYRILYDPVVSLTHLEFGSAATSEASMALMRRGRRIFRAKHPDFLKEQHSPGEDSTLFARARPGRRRVLYLEDTVPLRRLGSGFVRSNDIVHAIDAAGYEVHVFPINGAAYDMMSLLGDMPERAETLYDRDITRLEEFLKERRGYYDLLWVGRTHNLHRTQGILRKLAWTLPLVLDTEALAACRDASWARLQGEAFDLPAALAAEFAGLPTPDLTLAVNEAEAALLRAQGQLRVAVLGTARAASPTPSGFAAREGLLFLGAIHLPGAPNEDALRHYAKRIYPELARLMQEPPVLNVAGHWAPEISFEDLAACPGVSLRGEVGDSAPLYDRARIFIAPTRVAAGTPYKIYEAAAMGVPCVVTTLLADQLGWRHGEELLAVPVGDARGFAAAVARLYHDEALWTRLRQGALKRLARENTPAVFARQVGRILAQARHRPARQPARLAG
ncbi:glycosyltransferase [Acidocella sp.]|uniref:glycosyltransferase n=1 Tax=Acidocella sp. TaxID=50710 RepID=UPI002606C617|nr:glycosyltransferase [Acidocella sp.]